MLGLWREFPPFLQSGPASEGHGKLVATASLETEADDLWIRVCRARAEYFKTHVGEMPRGILTLAHLDGVWPWGGLLALPATKIGPETWCYSTFGLTNSDLPARAVGDFKVARHRRSRVARSAWRLRRRKPQLPNSAFAGYGYEVAIVVRENVEWPIWLLRWIVDAEIIHEARILDLVRRSNGLTLRGVEVGDEDVLRTESVNVLIAKAQPPLPSGTQLPNGRMELLVATIITDDEADWSEKKEGSRLLSRLRDAGPGQVSSRVRESVLTPWAGP